ncbi:MAG: hypothetical protein F6J95_006290 [Leptolyngbya sp. SIO1E4]|nr:hypothetical protein [Leptolyngbya sp. SIO1E4]
MKYEEIFEDISVSQLEPYVNFFSLKRLSNPTLEMTWGTAILLVGIVLGIFDLDFLNRYNIWIFLIIFLLGPLLIINAILHWTKPSKLGILFGGILALILGVFASMVALLVVGIFWQRLKLIFWIFALPCWLLYLCWLPIIYGITLLMKFGFYQSRVIKQASPELETKITGFTQEIVQNLEESFHIKLVFSPQKESPILEDWLVSLSDENGYIAVAKKDATELILATRENVGISEIDRSMRKAAKEPDEIDKLIRVRNLKIHTLLKTELFEKLEFWLAQG